MQIFELHDLTLNPFNIKLIIFEDIRFFIIKIMVNDIKFKFMQIKGYCIQRLNL